MSPSWFFGQKLEFFRVCLNFFVISLIPSSQNPLKKTWSLKNVWFFGFKSRFEMLLWWKFPHTKKKNFYYLSKKEKKVEKYCNDLQHNFLPLWQFCVEKELSATVGLSKKRKKSCEGGVTTYLFTPK